MNQKIKKFNLPPELSDILISHGITSLHPPQEEALQSGLLEGKNLVLSIPTAAGKTLIAEICMIKSLLEKKGRCLYIVPLRALASEKYEDFKKKYSALGISVGIATGEYDAPGNRLGRYDILIATSEKVDSLLRLKTPWLSGSLHVVVLDEIHYIHDPSRGPTLEIIAARLRQLNPSLQILALSATIANGRQLAAWLDANLVTSTWRPVPLMEAVYSDNIIYYSDFTTRSLVARKDSPVEALVTDVIGDGGQALVFVNSRRSTMSVARSLGASARERLTPGEKKSLQTLARAAGTVLSEPTHICAELEGAIRQGVAFHHAGLHPEQRRIVEDGFKSHQIKAICATPTLAAGVNLPARRVIIRDWARYKLGSGMRAIPVFEYKQFAGRAGRPGYDTEGEAILIAKKERDRERLFEEYIQAGTEPIESRLGVGSSLGAHILSSIAAGYATTYGQIMEFLSLTFFAMQREVSTLSRIVRDMLDFLLREEMILCRDKLTPDAQLYPTPFGLFISQLYLQPETGIILRDGLKNAKGRNAGEETILHLVASCPDMDVLSVGKTDYGPLLDEMIKIRDRLLIPYPEGEGESDAYRFLQALHTSRLLCSWIEEKTEEWICDEFGIGPGDIRRIIESADWLLYSTERLSSLAAECEIQPMIKELRRRIKYGIKKELLDLVVLKGIGRVRARNLFRKGFRTLEDIRAASVKTLGEIPTIGKVIAEQVKKQARIKTNS